MSSGIVEKEIAKETDKTDKFESADNRLLNGIFSYGNIKSCFIDEKRIITTKDSKLNIEDKLIYSLLDKFDENKGKATLLLGDQSNYKINFRDTGNETLKYYDLPKINKRIRKIYYDSNYDHFNILYVSPEEKLTNNIKTLYNKIDEHNNLIDISRISKYLPEKGLFSVLSKYYTGEGVLYLLLSFDIRKLKEGLIEPIVPLIIRTKYTEKMLQGKLRV